MPVPAGLTLYWGTSLITAIILITALIWMLLLGIRNRRGSGSRNTITATYEIRGTIEDTLKEIEKHFREHYKEPMEITKGENHIRFARRGVQSFISSLHRPFEEVTFTAENRSEDIVIITYSIALKRLRRNIIISTSLLILFVCLPIGWLLFQLIGIYVLPAFDVQGDLIPEITRQRRQVLHILHMIHIAWPPLALIAVFNRAGKYMRSTYNTILDKIQFIE